MRAVYPPRNEGDGKGAVSFMAFNSRTGRAASHRSWAQTVDRDARTLPGIEAARAKFEDAVDPDRKMSPATRAKAIRNAQQARMIELSERAVAARQARRKTRTEAERQAEFQRRRATNRAKREAQTETERQAEFQRRSAAQRKRREAEARGEAP